MNCTLTVVPQGAAGAAIRLEATGNESAKRVDEFLAALDKRIGGSCTRHMVPVLPLVLLVPLRLPCLLRMHKG